MTRQGIIRFCFSGLRVNFVECEMPVALAPVRPPLRKRLGGFDAWLRQGEDAEIGYRLCPQDGVIALVQSAPAALDRRPNWRSCQTENRLGF
jgi:hypothetical protein